MRSYHVQFYGDVYELQSKVKFPSQSQSVQRILLCLVNIILVIALDGGNKSISSHPET